MRYYLCAMIHQKVARYIKEEELLSPENKVLVALSGGADSVALLRVLLRLGYLCEAAHCNFHLRGEESMRDEDFVRTLCLQHSVLLHTVDFDTEAYAASHHLSIEMAARELRYAWFEELRQKTGASVIAVAHHRDDSVETLLLNLIRGTGINGLKGIRSKNGAVVRPLLAVGRDEIIAYLENIGQSYVTDSTNLQDEYTRNKIRLNLIPMMETINPSVKESISMTANRLSEVALIYNKAMEEGRNRVLSAQGIAIAELMNEPSPSSLLFELLYPLGFNSMQVEDVYNSLQGQAGRRFYSKEWCVVKDREYLLLRRNENTDGNVISAEPELLMERHACTKDFIIPKTKNTACLDADKLKLPLSVRKWRQGDSFVPFGMNGRKNVSDYLTDKKYSLFEKDRMYVLCCGEDIVWLVGERPDNRFRVDEYTKNILLIRINKSSFYCLDKPLKPPVF